MKIFVILIILNISTLIYANDPKIVCDTFFSNLDLVSCRAEKIPGCESVDYESAVYGKGKKIKCDNKELCVTSRSQSVMEACLKERVSVLPKYSITYCDPSNIRRSNGRIKNFELKGCDKKSLVDKTSCVHYDCKSREDFEQLTKESCVTYSNVDDFNTAMAQISSVGAQVSQYECLNETCLNNKWEVFLPEDKCAKFLQKCEMNRTQNPELPREFSRISTALSTKYLIPTSDLLTKFGQEDFYQFVINNETDLFESPASSLVAGNNISVNGMPKELGVKPGESYVQFVAPLSATEPVQETLLFLEKNYPKFKFKNSGSFESLGLRRFAFTYLPKE